VDALAAGNDALYEVDVFRGRFYVSTNEGAPHSRIFAVDPERPAREAWKEIVPERRTPPSTARGWWAASWRWCT